MSSSENFIGKKQEEIIEKVSRYIKESLKRNKSISLSDYYYFNSWAENFGKKKLRKIINIKQNFLDIVLWQIQHLSFITSQLTALILAKN